jgi:hypothetical protein
MWPCAEKRLQLADVALTSASTISASDILRRHSLSFGYEHMVHTRVVDADCDLGEYERGHQRTEKPFQLCLKKGDDRQNTARCVEKICDARLSWREMEEQAVAERRSDHPRVIPGMNSDGITRPARAGMPALFDLHPKSHSAAGHEQGER